MAGRFANGGPLVEVAMNSAGAKAGGPPPTANGSGSGGAAGGDGTLARADRDGWSRGGRQFASSREVYTRSLFRICLKFTTSEDEDEGKPEPGTAYWTLYGRTTTIGNGASGSATPDDICRRMDDSMTGPAAGVLARLTDFDGEQAALHALRAAMTTGWHIRGDRGDAAVRVGKAKIMTIGGSQNQAADGSSARKEVRLLTLDAERWVLCKGASFAAGNSVFNVEDVNEAKQKITVHCSKGPMRGKLIDIHASRCPYVFGRAHEADLCIMDRELSRKHGAILYLPNKAGKKGCNFILTDLESTVSIDRRFLVLGVVHAFEKCAAFVFFRPCYPPHANAPFRFLIISILVTPYPTVSFRIQIAEWLVHEAGRSLRTQGHGRTVHRR